MAIYSNKELVKKNLGHKIFKSEPKANFFIELNNLLCEYQDNLMALPPEKIGELEAKYKINMERCFIKDKKALFVPYLYHCLNDKKLADTETAELRYLQKLLAIPNDIYNRTLDKKTSKILNEEIVQALDDSHLSDLEKENLDRLQRDLGISDERFTELYKEQATIIMQKFMDNIISDQRISPEEDEELTALTKKLGVKVESDAHTQAILDKYRLYWQIENGDLPEIVPEINIQKSEKLYFKTDVDWFELRSVTQRVRYGGPTVRFKIVKGIYWRAGDLAVQTVSSDVMKHIDSGTVYLTNKRLIFMGNKGNKNIRLNKILSIDPFSNGVTVQKDTGKSPFLSFSNNIDLFTMIMLRLMRECL